ncbi:protein takeout-like [Spodoptera litura]|uniref:Takeout n=1 Tax=Spodoptera litura TaxID=69820 RepID=A0A3G1KKW4_SPOLT|nr:protein takeout-like [Spodoptera litura]ATU07283.1 takeout [Spodoptera litura]
MFTLSRFLTSIFILFSVLNGCLFKELPDYIHVCKRDPATINDCVVKSIEALRPQLTNGIPELGVPSIEPFLINEIKALTSDSTPLRASGHNIKVTGASAFVIKSLSVDLDTLKIRVHLRFPKLHFEGDYKLDAQVLIVPLKGQGQLNADAVKCDAELVFHSQIVTKDGVEYIKFKKIEADISIKDYRVKLDGLFNGDRTLGEAANQAINQNRGEFLKATKPHLEKTVATNLLQVANNIVDGLTLEQLFPKP